MSQVTKTPNTAGRFPRPKGAAGIKTLSDNVGRYLIFDERDAVAQLQFPLLQSLQSQQIGRGRLMQGIDRGVQVAVFLLQPCELVFELPLIFVGHDIRKLNTR